MPSFPQSKCHVGIWVPTFRKPWSQADASSHWGHCARNWQMSTASYPRQASGAKDTGIKPSHSLTEKNCSR